MARSLSLEPLAIVLVVIEHHLRWLAVTGVDIVERLDEGRPILA